MDKYQKLEQKRNERKNSETKILQFEKEKKIKEKRKKKRKCCYDLAVFIGSISMVGSLEKGCFFFVVRWL